MSYQSDLKSKTIKGVGWSAIDSIASQGIMFLVGLVLARLLSPEEYGLIGVITIFISISNTIVNSGFSNALIRKTNATKEDYSTAFLFNIVLGIVIYSVLFFCSPLIAVFFRQEQLRVLTRVFGIVIIINSFSIVQRTRLVRTIDFKCLAKISLISSLSSGIAGIIFAYYGFGVWALVIQQITREAATAIGLWILSHWKPSLTFSISSFKYQFNFGWKLLLSQLLNTIWNEANNVIIGRCYSAATLGQYTRAHQFSTLFSSNLTAVVQRVTFPVLSAIQDDKDSLRTNYKRLIKTIMFVSSVGMLSLAACAKPLIYVLIGEKWREAAVFLPILCFNLMLYPIRAINTNMLQVVGRTDQLLILEVIKKILYVVPLLLGVYKGVYWLLWGNVIAGVLGYILNSYFSGKFINYSTGEQVIDILPSLLFAIVVSGGMYLCNLFVFSSFITLILQIIVGLVLIIVLGESTKIEPYVEIKEIIAGLDRKFF